MSYFSKISLIKWFTYWKWLKWFESSKLAKILIFKDFWSYIVTHYHLTRRICNIRSAFFALLRKSYRVKKFKETRLIFAFFQKFVRFFKNSKNWKVQTLWSLSFHAIETLSNRNEALKIVKFVNFRTIILMLA